MARRQGTAQHPLRRRVAGALAGLTVAVCAVALPGPSASAEPATAPAFPAGAASSWFRGYAFDTCDAPSDSAMRAWQASPYRAVGIYVGGLNRGCKTQSNLTPTWLTDLYARGWRAIPIYVGRQAPCADRSFLYTISRSPSSAESQGEVEAADAVSRARTLGLRAGSAIYNDLENYSRSDSGCRAAVLQYLSGWTRGLHHFGYVSGVYANLSSGAADLAGAYTSTGYARPDAIWVARYDGLASTSGWSGVSSALWSVHQRGKQYLADNRESYGGVSLSIDRNVFDGPVATVLVSYRVTASSGLNARSGPSTAYPVTRGYADGATLPVLCQAPGSKVGSTAVWDRLWDGSYVTDMFVSTPSKTTYTSTLPLCRYPYQVSASPSLRKRTTPSSGGTVAGSIANGGLAWVTCQAPGSKVGSTSVWDRLYDGSYVADGFVATASSTSWTGPAPRC